MEARYDAIMLSPAGRKLMELDQRQRYVIEAGLYALMAYVEERWTPESPVLRGVKKVAVDAPPEVAKRLVNGFREQVVADLDGDVTEERREVISSLLALNDEDLFSFATWMASSSPQERRRLVGPADGSLPPGAVRPPGTGASSSIADVVLSDIGGLRRSLERRQRRRRDRSR